MATVLGSGMTMLDGTVVSVALPSIGRDLHASLDGLQWTVNGYTLTLAALILLPALGPIILGAYFLAGMILNKKPPHLYVDQDESKYWQRVRQSPKRTAREIRGKMKDIDRRLAEVETYYVTSNPRLSAEIERLR